MWRSSQRSCCSQLSKAATSLRGTDQLKPLGIPALLPVLVDLIGRLSGFNWAGNSRMTSISGGCSES